MNSEAEATVKQTSELRYNS